MWDTLVLTLPEPGLSLSFEGSHTTHVYLAFHTTTGYSPCTKRSPTVSVPLAHCRLCLVDFPPFLRYVGQNQGSP